MSDERSGRSGVRGSELPERLRTWADNLRMEGAGDKAFLREVADLIESLEKQVFLHEDSWKEALTIIEKLRGMFRKMGNAWYFDGHRYSLMHGSVKLNKKGEEAAGVR